MGGPVVYKHCGSVLSSKGGDERQGLVQRDGSEMRCRNPTQLRCQLPDRQIPGIADAAMVLLPVEPLQALGGQCWRTFGVGKEIAAGDLTESPMGGR